MQTTSNPLASKDKSSSYRPEIDGLRSLAVVAVIINHFNKEIIPSGYLGVDIFFVISGYVITSSLANRQHKHFGDFLLGFYSRRIKRLVPALVLCVFLGSVAICAFNPDPDISLKTGVTALFGFSNLFLFKQSTDYFGISAELNAFTHTWSLGVEEQFYFLFPFLVWGSGFGRQTVKGSQYLLFGVGSLSIASIIVFLFLSTNNEPAAYFLMPSRFWEMGAGCLLFLALDRRKRSIGAITQHINPTFVLCLLIGALFIPRISVLFSIAATFAVVAMTIGSIASLRPGTIAYKLFTQPQVVALGLLSYSLYLWHWIVLVISRWTIGIHWWSIPIQVGLMLLLAIISYNYVEKPLRKIEWSPGRGRTIGYGLGVAAIVATTILSIGNNRVMYVGSRSNGIKQQTKSAILTQSIDRDSLKISASGELVNTCNMTPHQLSGKSYRPQPNVNDDFISKCLKHASQQKKVVLVGDSFADVMAKHVSVLAKSRGYAFAGIFGYGCPYPLRKEYIPNATAVGCDVNSGFLGKSIASHLKAGDILVLRLYFPKDQYINYRHRDSLPPVDVYDKEILNLLRDVTSNRASMVIIGSNPTRELVTPGCGNPQWFNVLQRDSCRPIDVSKSPKTAFALAHDRHLTKILTGVPGVRFVPVADMFCDRQQSSCPIEIGGDLVYFDEQHLTASLIDRIYPRLNDAFQSIEQRSSKSDTNQ
jgi:peptidoglycan/LPS O-acetylase OafA/YrhL